MANREEILKKINAELEMLNDEELEQVAGGRCAETADDSRFLNSLNGSTDRYGEYRIGFENHDQEIINGWATVGVKAELHTAWLTKAKNKYYVDGQQVTQEEARQHAMKVTGHYMTKEQWNW